MKYLVIRGNYKLLWRPHSCIALYLEVSSPLWWPRRAAHSTFKNPKMVISYRDYFQLGALLITEISRYEFLLFWHKKCSALRPARRGEALLFYSHPILFGKLEIPLLRSAEKGPLRIFSKQPIIHQYWAKMQSWEMVSIYKTAEGKQYHLASQTIGLGYMHKLGMGHCMPCALTHCIIG